MHGNETTTTKAVLDLVLWLIEPEQQYLIEKFSFFIIPQLNPDGALDYKRLNYNSVDLNRDAINLSQPESRTLRNIFDNISPYFCLNLHDQRTIYGAGKNGNPATLSFLAPAASESLSITSSRFDAMIAIVEIKKKLEKFLPQAIGRYNEEFNLNCVGDTFAREGVPTILFEAGHYPGDYQRETTRSYVLKAFKILFKYLYKGKQSHNSKDYFEIPENYSNYVDLIVSNVSIKDNDKVFKNQELAIQYNEVLENGKLIFYPQLKSYSSKLNFKAHRYLKFKSTESKYKLNFSVDKVITKPKFYKLFSVKS